MNSLIVRPEAEADVQDAYSWYESRSAGLGDEFLNAVGIALAASIDNPPRFPIVHEDADASVRRALLKRFPYGIYFVWNESGNIVTVIACLHARQEPRRLLRRIR